MRIVLVSSDAAVGKLEGNRPLILPDLRGDVVAGSGKESGGGRVCVSARVEI